MRLVTPGAAGRRTLELPACLVRVAREGVAVEWRDMACPAIVTLLERITGQRAAELLEDQAFSRS